MVARPAVLSVDFLELYAGALDLRLLALGHLGEEGLGEIVASPRTAVLVSAQDPTKVQTSSLVGAVYCFGFSVVS